MVLAKKRKKPTKTKCDIWSSVVRSEDYQLTVECLKTTSTVKRATPRGRRLVALLMVLALLVWPCLVENFVKTASDFGFYYLESTS